MADKEYIERNSLISEIEANINTYWNEGNGGYYIAEDALNDSVKTVPTTDVVEVVRCKNCRCWEECDIDPITNYHFGYCRHYQWQDKDCSRETNGQDYCSYGERKSQKEV